MAASWPKARPSPPTLMSELREDDAELGRDTVGDDDPELAAFFDGEDLSAPLVPDGGKGLIINDEAD